ncbi:MAG TPA: DinB family protein [Ignavibacteriaceae bacterium]|nr:DinB family protein [Ignavibacteriaceae bacterium]
MFKDHLIHLFKYNDWATGEAARRISVAKNNEQRVYNLLSHIVNSQMIWPNRILQKDIVINPWENHIVERCVELSTEISSEWINFLESLEEAELDKRIKYKNNKGETWENTIGDIVTHIINHSTYHRAQIAQLMRQSDDQPPKTDYIIYQRHFQK